MPPTRSIRSTRARTPTRPAKPSKEATRSHLQKPPAPSKRTELTMTVDGITHGWQYSHLYTEPEPEVDRYLSSLPRYELLNCLPVQMHRQPDPSIKRPVDPRAPPLKLKDLECVRSLGQSTWKLPSISLSRYLQGRACMAESFSCARDEIPTRWINPDQCTP